MIDPPWNWEAWSDKGEEKSPNAQYTTMTMAAIAALPVGQLLRGNGVVWVWCTWPLIAKQTRMIEDDWGLVVRTGGAWAKRTASGKLRLGPGYILRSVCEPFLICTAGAGSGHGFGDGSARNLIETIEDKLVDGVAREHSRKPEEAYRLIEDLTPNWWRVDVFSREKRDGWDNWGNEATKFNEAAE
jgi:N6-adenosine-specific RNA methylase IME4